MNKQVVVALTSGGVDSIALTWILAKRNPHLTFLPLYFWSKPSGAYVQREHGINQQIHKLFAPQFPNVLEPQRYDGYEMRITRGRTEYRNQLYLDAVARLYGQDSSVVGVSLGVVPGQETGSWVHGWSLAVPDHNPVLLTEHLRKQKPEWKLWTYKDFEGEIPDIGKKSARVILGVKELGVDWLWKTNSCQKWFLGKKPGIYSYLGEGIPAVGGCGNCHSCVARYVSIRSALGVDKTPYRNDPIVSRWVIQYAIEYRNVTIFLESIPFCRDGKMLRQELGSWMQGKLPNVSSCSD